MLWATIIVACAAGVQGFIALVLAEKPIQPPPWEMVRLINALSIPFTVGVFIGLMLAAIILGVNILAR